MTVRFDAPLFYVDPYVQFTFADVVNALVGSTNPAEVNRNMLRLCTRSVHLNPDAYFRWGFEDHDFWIQQRIACNAQEFFPKRILTVLYYTPSTMLPRGN